MGAKTRMLVIADGNAREALSSAPPLDREATHRLVSTLFPDEKLKPLDDGCLTRTNPSRGEIYAGCFPGVCILAAKEFAIDYPSKLHPRFLTEAGQRSVTLHCMISTVDSLSFGVWEGGSLKRALSLSPDGIAEDVGSHLQFEEPYWARAHPVLDDEGNREEYPLPFHPLELADAALVERFGYSLEDDSSLNSDAIPLMRFRRSSRQWWKFW